MDVDVAVAGAVDVSATFVVDNRANAEQAIESTTNRSSGTSGTDVPGLHRSELRPMFD